MPSVVPTPEQRALLTELRAGWAFQWTQSQTAPLTPNGLPAPGKAKPGQECKCVLIERHTGKGFASGYGPDEPSAFNTAVESAKTAERPMTPAEQSVEIKRLREELAAAKAGDVIVPEAPARVTAGELVKQMKAKGISIPVGNHKSQLWRDQAMQRLADAEALETEPELEGVTP